MSRLATACIARPASAYDKVGALAMQCLWREVRTWPKPGLVSHIDNGSHDDMDAAVFKASAQALRPYFSELAQAGAEDASMHALRRIGIRAEAAMLVATRGINTHRGAIFGLGLLCAAWGWRHVRGQGDDRLGAIVAARWGEAILQGPRASDSHGEGARRRYGAGGAREEAAAGFPSIYLIGLPALRDAAVVGAHAARVQACFALIAAVDDTNLLHRGGADGLRFAQVAARDFLLRGGVKQRAWEGDAAAVHAAFVERRLSPGGAADLLAMSLFVSACQ